MLSSKTYPIGNTEDSLFVSIDNKESLQFPTALRIVVDLKYTFRQNSHYRKQSGFLIVPIDSKESLLFPIARPIVVYLKCTFWQNSTIGNGKDSRAFLKLPEASETRSVWYNN